MKVTQLLIAGCFLLIIGCGGATSPTKPGNNEPEPIPEGEFSSTNYNFFSSKDTITVIILGCECKEKLLQKNVTFSKIHYQLNENELVFKFSDVYLTNDTTKVFVYERFVRNSGQNSILGIWVKDSSWFTSEKTLSSADSGYAKAALERTAIHSHIKIDESLLVSYSKGTSANLASKVLGFWMDSLNAHYSIELFNSTSKSFKLRGKINNDTVTVTEDAQYNRIFESTNPEYVDYTWKAVPQEKDCPNNKYPDWIYLFLQANKVSIKTENQ